MTGADNNTVTFGGATGTLIVDHSSTFTGNVAGLTGTGSTASSDIIDLRDVVLASATENYIGNTLGGTLTVGDTQGHVANISLVGDYTNSTFTLSSDGRGGTFVIDPPIGQLLAGAPVAGSSGTTPVRAFSGVEPSTQSEAAVYAPRAAIGSVDRSSVGNAPSPDLRLVLNPLAGTVARPTEMLFVDSALNQAAATTAQPTLPAQGAAAIRPDNGGATQRAASFQAAVPVVPGEPSKAAMSNDTMVREIVSPNDVIRAINGGNIALKFGKAGGEAASQHIWLFDETNDSLVPPARQAVRIVLDDHDHAGASALPVEAMEEAAGLLATATMIAGEPMWLGKLRQIRRKAAGVLWHGTKWTE